MRSRLSTAFLAITSVCLLLSCNGKDTNTTVTDNTLSANDSSALRIAILPIEECAPLRYAQESGLAKRMGLDIIFVEYEAMMDVDTAILSNVAHVYFGDSARIGNIKADSLRPTLLFPIPVKMSLIVNKDKDIKDLSELKANMVGLTRASALETWMNVLTDSAHVEQDEVYHAQINSIPVRFRMLNGGLIDAGIMPRPWADSLVTLGHTAIREEILDGMGFYISAQAHADSTILRHAELLKKVYLEAMAMDNGRL